MMASDPIHGDSIRANIKAWFDDSFGNTPYEVRLDIGDARTLYDPQDPGELQAIIKKDPRLSPSLYRRGYFDCEDFAIAARASIVHERIAGKGRGVNPPAFGLLFANSHATNIGIAPGGEPFILDVYYNVLWRGQSLEGLLVDDIGRGWVSPRSVRYILI